MLKYPEPIAKLIEELKKLPGIGEKSASRLAFYLLRAPEESIRELARSLIDLKEKITLCGICFNITDITPCYICRENREDIICVVEDPLDLIAIERSGAFKGRYHVLHGVISPIDGIGPEALRIKELIERVKRESIKEVLIATNFTVEGEATAVYIMDLLKKMGIKVTRIAQGLPAGSDIEYADRYTLSRALQGRREL